MDAALLSCFLSIFVVIASYSLLPHFLIFLIVLYIFAQKGGLLLFHDRWFPDPVTSSRCKTAGFDINIIQVSRTLLDHFLSFFEREPFYSEEQTQYQVSRSKDWCQWRDDEIGYWTVLRKKKNGPKFD
jgi:hypothetical protein